MKSLGIGEGSKKIRSFLSRGHSAETAVEGVGGKFRGRELSYYQCSRALKKNPPTRGRRKHRGWRGGNT